jgi:hypothetical protein
MRPLAAFLAAALIGLVGCGGGGDGDTRGTVSDRQEILSVMEEGRDALLKRDGGAACRLLTDHGRDRTLQYQVDFLEEGTRVPSTDPQAPQTCESMVPAVLNELGSPLRSTIENVEFQVVSIDGDDGEATVAALKDNYNEATFNLLKDPDEGWRIDDSNDVPSGY